MRRIGEFHLLYRSRVIQLWTLVNSALRATASVVIIAHRYRDPLNVFSVRWRQWNTVSRVCDQNRVSDPCTVRRTCDVHEGIKHLRLYTSNVEQTRQQTGNNPLETTKERLRRTRKAFVHLLRGEFNPVYRWSYMYYFHTVISLHLLDLHVLA